MQVLNPTSFDLRRFLESDATSLDLGWGEFEKKISKYLQAVSPSCPRKRQLVFDRLEADESSTPAWTRRTRR